MKTSTKLKLNASQRKSLAVQMERVARTTREAFESRFKAWQETWFSAPLAISSDPSSRTHSVEFHNLVALGPSILPLVIDQMTDTSNFFAVALYDAIQPDRALIVQYDADDDRIDLGEQGRAAEVVNAYLRTT